MFELNHPIKAQHVSTAESPHVMIISILTKDNFFYLSTVETGIFYCNS